ncbi:MAG: hypothetical protein Q9181_004227 [Wetmoreana brouardii]
MSSIFTFDPDPPKALISPWPVPPAQQHRDGPAGQAEASANDEMPQAIVLADLGVNALEPEPQDGPTEYKLHLLLRPRRSFSALSTVQHVSGSHLSKSRLSRSENGVPPLAPKLPLAPASSNQSRQARLQHLTTQLLWRLQQSSPHHPASRSDLIVPILPEALDSLPVPRTPGKLLPGLGDSQGALYELGVADDGTLVGLTGDELDESLDVLRAMASSLGCRVKVLRRIIVGDCQWLEDAGKTGKATRKSCTEKLWVAEVLVCPDLALDRSEHCLGQNLSDFNNVAATGSSSMGSELQSKAPKADQLRVSLTGSTTSGKSSLLGTLSTSTLDNGRGKSRLSLLKHRHEIASGVTSSVTSSLIGYHDRPSTSHSDNSGLHVINYASGNVSSWTDIHSASDPGRLVLLTDSAGHPKFRRTIVRGLVSWAPHWTICCIAADHEQDTTGRAGSTASASDILGTACAEMDLAKAHLELCLNLRLPLIVVITKLDLASMSALKPMLGRILSILKSAGRRPEILSCPSEENSITAQSVNPNDKRRVLELLSGAPGAEACSMVPIVLTSAVTGRGMDKLHALLRHLPRPPSLPSLVNLDEPKDDSLRPSILFHIDEIFAAHKAPQCMREGGAESSLDSILSGHLRHGPLAIGQEMIIGPFSTSSFEADPPTPEVHRASSYPKLKGSPKPSSSRRILPRPLSGDFTTTTRGSEGGAASTAVWRRVRICSIRNLRLPVHSLSSDQAGTIGLGAPTSATSTDLAPLAPLDRIRKGMVLMNVPDESIVDSLQVYNGFVASFGATEVSTFHPGMSVIAYMASIRAPARVLHLQTMRTEGTPDEDVSGPAQSTSGKGGMHASDITLEATRQIKMTFQFLTSQDWFELGSQVLIMPASPEALPNATGERSDKTSVGLEGVVGRIIQGLA